MHFTLRRLGDLAELRRRLLEEMVDVDDQHARDDVLVGVSELAAVGGSDAPVRVTASVVSDSPRPAITVVLETAADGAWDTFDLVSRDMTDAVVDWTRRRNVIGGSAVVVRRRFG